MSDLVLHAATKTQLENFSGHALLLAGPEGIGKTAVAEELAQQILELSSNDQLQKYPHMRLIVPENGSISIDAVRDLRQFIKLKIVGAPSEKPRRIIVLEQAHTMTAEAQNALLKVLEEPPDSTLLVLTASSERQLLPTIRSRVQTISIKRPAQAALLAYFAAQNFDEIKINQTYLMSGGLPGLMSALLTEVDHPLAQAAMQARQLLQTSPFERLTTVDSLAKQKADCLRMLAVLQQMAHAALEQSATNEAATTNRTLGRWQRILTASYEAEGELLANAQAKLVLTNFMLAL